MNCSKVGDAGRQVKPAAEVQAQIEAAVRSILEALGEDPGREGLLETPARVARMYQEVFAGRNQDPAVHLETQFTADAHEDVVIVKDISFFSMCEHHLLPFFGKASVAYLPDGGRLAGLSKLARVTHTIAARPQLQERLCVQIADTLDQALRPRGVMVSIEAEHMCMAMRGVRADKSTTITLVTRGELSTDPRLRSETLRLLRD
ncbi:MAG: GTP cyclohydrolase I FolE [Pseudomonadota bacterium]|jgi:GTP cyclohydrolase I|nr:GTP cyclohydrolase I FolE [Pseudomonadota bacterium]|tara:strand:+ start:8954 stop:9565 length:612 start_codon:yes stop_codon:yes gene_type:complete